MKKRNLLLLIVLFITPTLTSIGQESPVLNQHPSKAEAKTSYNSRKMQIGIEGLNFGFGYGRVIGSIGIRYGYFVAKNSLLFTNFEYSTYGSNYNSYKFGLHFRQYFVNKKIKPYVQIGTNIGWEDLNNDDDMSMVNEIIIGGGITFEIGRFNIDVGAQMNVWDNIYFKPTVGLSFKF